MSLDFQKKYLLSPQRFRRSFRSGKTLTKRLDNDDAEVFIERL